MATGKERRENGIRKVITQLIIKNKMYEKSINPACCPNIG